MSDADRTDEPGPNAPAGHLRMLESRNSAVPEGRSRDALPAERVVPATLVARLAAVVHDLRTPLAAIVSWTWALRRGLDGERATHALEALERNARRQARLLDEAAETLRAAMALRPASDGRAPSSASRLRDVLRAGRDVLAPGDTIRYAAARLRTLGLGALPVCDGERLLGVLTDRDVTDAVAVGRDPLRTAVIEAIPPDCAVAREDQAVGDAVALMYRHALRHLPVVDADRRLVGMVTLVDLLASGPDATMAADATRAAPGPERGP